MSSNLIHRIMEDVEDFLNQDSDYEESSLVEDEDGEDEEDEDEDEDEEDEPVPAGVG